MNYDNSVFSDNAVGCESRLSLFENLVPRRVFGPKEKEINRRVEKSI
jgi:hypothetical protein